MIKNTRLIAVCLCWFCFSCREGNPIKPLETKSSWISITDGLTNQTIQCITAVADDKQVIYAGTFNGVYKTRDGGSTWSAVNSGLTGLDVRSIAVHPENPDMVFCGTWGKGVFMSANAGETWSSCWREDQDPRIQVLRLSPHAAQQVWAGTENGLYISEDLGVNWNKCLYGKISAIGLHPYDPKFVMVSIRYHGQIRSLDGGTTWEEVNTGIHRNDSGFVWATTILYGPGDPNMIVIDTNGYKDMYLSSDGGLNWVPFAEQLNPYDVSVLAADPGNGLKMWAATLDQGVWRSVDGGTTWQACNTGLPSLDIESLCLIPGADAVVLAGPIGQGIYKYQDREK